MIHVTTISRILSFLKKIIVSLTRRRSFRKFVSEKLPIYLLEIVFHGMFRLAGTGFTLDHGRFLAGQRCVCDCTTGSTSQLWD